MAQIVDASLTKAHHKLGDLLDAISHGDIVRINHGARHKPVAFMISPETMQELWGAVKHATEDAGNLIEGMEDPIEQEEGGI